jgi:TPR repeat protein
LEKNVEESLKWIHKAANNGHINAQYTLGGIYLHGTTVTKDAAEAMRWFRLAAERGHAIAQNDIGYGCEKGVTGITNLQDAYVWYQLAAKQGEKKSQFNLNRLLTRISLDDMLEGDRRVKEFIPKPIDLPNPIPGYINP